MSTSHLHRNMLAVGPCKSHYFTALFRTPMAETTTKTSDIKFRKDAADAVPLILDFIYTQKLGKIISEQQCRFVFWLNTLESNFYFTK